MQEKDTLKSLKIFVKCFICCSCETNGDDCKLQKSTMKRDR